MFRIYLALVLVTSGPLAIGDYLGRVHLASVMNLAPSVPAAVSLSSTGKQQPGPGQTTPTSGSKIRECRRGLTFIYGIIPTVDYIEKPQPDETTVSGYTCCYFINGEPQCPDPPEAIRGSGRR